MTTTANKNISRAIQLFSLITFLSFLSACGSENTPPLTETNKSTLALPSPLQKLTLNGGTLRAFLILDNDQLNPIEMSINTDGEGSATVVIPNLSRATHNIVITYEYTEAGNTITLAELNTNVDLSSGNRDLNILANAYDLNFDQDNDGVNNAAELLAQTDPFFSNLVTGNGFTLSAQIAVPQISASATGVLRGYITIGDNPRREFTIQSGNTTTNINIENLASEIYSVLIEYEYTDDTGTFKIAEATQSANLLRSGISIDFNETDLELRQFDFDGDGSSNANELLLGSNPRALELPFIAATLTLNPSNNTLFDFSWVDVDDATFYRLFEIKSGSTTPNKLGADIPAGTQFTSQETSPILTHIHDKYLLQSCNSLGCIDGVAVDSIDEVLVDAIDYIKSDGIKTNISNSVRFAGSISLSKDGKTLAASNIELNSSFETTLVSAFGKTKIFIKINNQWEQQANISSDNAIATDSFGAKVALSRDGNTLAISAPDDNNLSTGINNTSDGTPIVRNNLANTNDYFGDPTIITALGAVYIFTRDNLNNWTQEAYIKPSNPDVFDNFSRSISLSDDGNTLVAGSRLEDSNAIGTNLNNDQTNNTATNSGAAYIFTRTNSTWAQQAYLKASNAEALDLFGDQVELSGDALTLTVCAQSEDSQGTGVDNAGIIDTNEPLQSNNLSTGTGAAYIFVKNSQNEWNQQAYIKASNTELKNDGFCSSISLNENGNTLAIGANLEDSNNRNDQSDNSSASSGAAYIFTRDNNIWSQQDYIKADNISSPSFFGGALDLSDNGNSLAIGAIGEKNSAPGFNDETNSIELQLSGAAYLFVRNTNNQWNQKNHLKASNPSERARFGDSVSISGDATSLAISALFDNSSATGINGDQLNGNGDAGSGAIYMY